mmetsp:Transcript_4849/g.8422  ORF Transcript_4849/g.8422 Transcript_4849/m.8422 type:complete len:501 (-) Transcript_4849:200-1702(-)
MAPQEDMDCGEQCQREPVAHDTPTSSQPVMACADVASWPFALVSPPMLVDPSYVGYAAVWACPAPVPAWEMWGADNCLQAVPVSMHAVSTMHDGRSVPSGLAAVPMWEAPNMQVLPGCTPSWSDCCAADTEGVTLRQADGDECPVQLSEDPAATKQDSLPPDMLAARMEPDACGSLDVEQQSVASSSCSTAPSIVVRRRRKPRAPPAQRQADAARHREAERMAQELLQREEDLSARFKAGGETASAALAQLSGIAWHLSLDSAGCRIVQDAIDAATGSARAEVVKDLRGHVREAMGSPHANYVMQRVVEVMPIEIACFVAEELAGIAADACRHRYGCRIMCRLIEQFARSTCVMKLIEEMMKEVADLAKHSFAHHVMQAVLEHGANKYRHTIAKELAKDILANALNRNGTYVIERALLHCESKEVSMLMRLLTENDVLDNLMSNQFGIFIVKTLLQTAPRQLVDRIWAKVNSPPEDVFENKNFQKLLELLQEDADEGETA